MEKYEIEMYEKEDGSCPVAEFLDELEPKMWAKITRNIDVLSEHNLNLREPLVKSVENGIFELRTQSGNNIARGRSGGCRVAGLYLYREQSALQHFHLEPGAGRDRRQGALDAGPGVIPACRDLVRRGACDPIHSLHLWRNHVPFQTQGAQVAPRLCLFVIWLIALTVLAVLTAMFFLRGAI